ncbi:MAG: phosphoenolpyruvate-protein phosphotransferase system enzyme [Chloroflexota bacterium]|nr:phosphoenolpyruvate-protein phosphotransferase system enzyme [Chloroflexota bacterium]
MRLRGEAAAPGAAVGPAWIYRAVVPSNGSVGPAGIGLELAAERAAGQLQALADGLRGAGREEQAGILEAQSLMARDETLLAAARELIAAGSAPAAAVHEAGEAIARGIEALDDELLAARAADVRDVAARIGRASSGHVLDLPRVPSIALADDLPASIAAEIPNGLLLGIGLAAGSPTAHAAILARSLGIPAAVGLADLAAYLEAPSGPAGHVETGTVALDGFSGELLIEPTSEELAAIGRRVATSAAQARAAATLRGRPGATRDGRPVRLLANLGGPDEVDRALQAGAEGVGLFRTEFLFLGRTRPPEEDEQARAYAAVLGAFGPDRPVVIRLADIGGDKEVPYLGLAPEANPFLGLRGIRLARTRPELLVAQLRAIARAAAATGTSPHVMAPMVATVEDVDLFDELRREAARSLSGDVQAAAGRIVAGIMVEVPSAVWLAPELVRRVSFMSIGTNDLTQYLFAADRTNSALAPYRDTLNPAVLRAVAAVVDAARPAGVPVAVCGELGGTLDGARVLVGLGVTELSMDPGSIDLVRAVLADSPMSDLEALAEGLRRGPTAG